MPKEQLESSFCTSRVLTELSTAACCLVWKKVIHLCDLNQVTCCQREVIPHSKMECLQAN